MANSHQRLNWGCGKLPAPGWINSDINEGEGVDIQADIRLGLPLASDSIDYISSIHALQDLTYFDLVPALHELRRILKSAGVLRLCLPDLERGIAAYRQNNKDYFYIPDDEIKCVGGKLITQIIWYGSTRTPMLYDFVEELLVKAGFREVRRCGFRQTQSRFPEIVELDNRERESFFVEAVK